MQRPTRQRTAIAEVFERQRGRPLSPPEVQALACQGGAAPGIATVYRTLKAMTEQGLLRVVQLPGQLPRYEPAAQAHHHHFLCTRCGRVFDVPGCPGQLEHLAPPGFSVERHDITLYGQCGECAAAAA